MKLNKEEIQSIVVKLIEEMSAEWGLERDQPIDPASQLIADLEFSSIDFVQLFVLIEEQVKRKLGFHDLLMVDGKYIDDLSVGALVDFIEAKLNSTTVSTVQSPETLPRAEIAVDQKINLDKVERFRNGIPSPPLREEAVKNSRPIIFVLCPSRSGSTLLRVILAGHPQLFAPPELHLLTYDTLAQRKASLSDDLNNHLLNGAIDAIMQAKQCDFAVAEQLMQGYESENLSTASFYAQLQDWLGDRVLVDKTPSYSYHLNILKRAESSFFSNAIYIHLLRHPYGMIRSFEDAKLDRLVPFMRSDRFSRREYAELAWLICQQNIRDFLKDVPSHRQTQIKFEDLVSTPQITLTGLCDFLGMDFHPDMLDPYREKSQRMTDGGRTVARMSGDLKFHLHDRIEPDAAYRWRKFQEADFLGDITWELAEALGYSRV